VERDIEDQHVSCVSCDLPRHWSKSAHERTTIVKGIISSLEPIIGVVKECKHAMSFVSVSYQDVRKDIRRRRRRNQM